MIKFIINMKKFFLLLVISTIFTAMGYTQSTNGVIISNNPDSMPAPSAVLEVQSEDKGVLIPRVEQGVREDETIIETTDGLLVFQKDGEKGFWYYDEHYGDWLRIWEEGDGTKGFIMPKGGIIMYHGSDSLFDEKGVGLKGTEMEGWALCNGKNNRPDLRGKFIVGGGDSDRKDKMDQIVQEKIDEYSCINKEGGNSNDLVSLNKEHLPSHFHPYNLQYNAQIIHNHDLISTQEGLDPVHTHYMKTTSSEWTTARKLPSRMGLKNSEKSENTSGGKSKLMNRTLSFSVVEPYCTYAEPEIEFNISEDNKDKIIENSGEVNLELDIRPKYYVIAFIIRTDSKPNENYDDIYEIDYYNE